MCQKDKMAAMNLLGSCTEGDKFFGIIYGIIHFISGEDSGVWCHFFINAKFCILLSYANRNPSGCTPSLRPPQFLSAKMQMRALIFVSFNLFHFSLVLYDSNRVVRLN